MADVEGGVDAAPLKAVAPWPLPSMVRLKALLMMACGEVTLKTGIELEKRISSASLGVSALKAWMALSIPQSVLIELAQSVTVVLSVAEFT